MKMKATGYASIKLCYTLIDDLMKQLNHSRRIKRKTRQTSCLGELRHFTHTFQAAGSEEGAELTVHMFELCPTS